MRTSSLPFVNVGLLLILVMATLLSGCAPAATPTEPPAEPTATDAPAPTEEEAMPTEPPESEAEPIRLGFSSPQSGPAAGVGEQQRWGAELAVKEINAAGGVLGRPLELVVEDNACNPAEGVTAASSLLEQDISAFAGPMCSSVALAILDLFQEAEVPVVIGVATSPDITPLSGVGGNEWAFRITPSDASMAAAEVPYLVDEGIESIALVAEDSDFGRGVAEAFATEADAHGITVTSSDFFAKGTPDFNTILTRIDADSPDGIAIFAVGGDDINLVRQILSFGMEARIVGRPELDLLFDELEDPSGLEGAVSVIQYTTRADTPENNAFIEAFQAEYGANPVLQGAQGYQQIYVIAEAIERAGSDDPAAIRDALEDTDYLGLMGAPISFDENNQAHPNIAIFVVRDGEVVVDELMGS